MVELERRALSKADKSTLKEIVELGSSDSGSIFLTFKGGYYSVPKGMSPTGIPKDDPLGEEMLDLVQKIADRFKAKYLTEDQKRALFKASPSERGGLTGCFQGNLGT